MTNATIPAPTMTGPELKDALRELGISQKWLAHMLGVAVPTMWRWCQGEWPIPEYLVFTIRLLRLLPEELMEDLIDDSGILNRGRGRPFADTPEGEAVDG